MDRRNFVKTFGWSALGLAATGTLLSGCKSVREDRSPRQLREQLSRLDDLRLWWGDLHNHCNVTYGHGDLADALAAAREQLDFCTVTPHALWPDIPSFEDKGMQWVIGYHLDAFRRLRDGGFERYVKALREANEDSRFLTFSSYECHSMEHGDHVVLCRDYDTPLVEASSVPELKEKLRNQRVYVTPHHMGYMTGFRGYNWDAFQDGDPMTPFVEMYSRHGLAESDQGDYDYLHDMGPRIFGGSVQYGLEQGHQFGLMCSTDQHAGYPGSYGDGRIGVLADQLDKDRLWEALGARHIMGVTGDKIKIDFSIDGAKMGDIIRDGRREIMVAVQAQNYIDYVDIIKNARCIARLNGPFTAPVPEKKTIRAKIPVSFGWNREETYVHWNGELRLSEGCIRGYQTCFRGAAFTSPQPGETAFKTRVNRVLDHDERHLVLDMFSCKNPNTMTPATQGVILDVEMPLTGTLNADFGGKTFTHTLEELLRGSQAHFMRGWLSEAIQFGRAVPEEAFSIGTLFTDPTPERDTDYYYVRVRQRNGQWAFSSPIWVERKT